MWRSSEKRGAFVKISSFQDPEKNNTGISGTTENELDSKSDLLFFTSPYSALGFKAEMQLSEIIEEKGLPITVTKIDVTRFPEAAEKYNIVATPTLIFRELRACGHYEQDALEDLLISHCFFGN
jgi:hypothetical protein